MSILAFLDVLEWVLANLTFEVLPDVRVDIWSFLAVTFALEPFLEATDTDPAERAGAFAGRDKLMMRQLLF